jgi:hypothetical protein
LKFIVDFAARESISGNLIIADATLRNSPRSQRRRPKTHGSTGSLIAAPLNVCARCAPTTSIIVSKLRQLNTKLARTDLGARKSMQPGRTLRESANASAAHLLDNEEGEDGGRLRRWWLRARYTAQGDEQRSLQPSLRRCVKSVALLEGKYTGVGFAEP